LMGMLREMETPFDLHAGGHGCFPTSSREARGQSGTFRENR
jgi:hypothetical protein